MHPPHAPFTTPPLLPWPPGLPTPARCTPASPPPSCGWKPPAPSPPCLALWTAPVPWTRCRSAWTRRRRTRLPCRRWRACRRTSPSCSCGTGGCAGGLRERGVRLVPALTRAWVGTGHGALRTAVRMHDEQSNVVLRLGLLKRRSAGTRWIHSTRLRGRTPATSACGGTPCCGSSKRWAGRSRPGFSGAVAAAVLSSEDNACCMLCPARCMAPLLPHQTPGHCSPTQTPPMYPAGHAALRRPQAAAHQVSGAHGACGAAAQALPAGPLCVCAPRPADHLLQRGAHGEIEFVCPTFAWGDTVVAARQPYVAGNRARRRHRKCTAQSVACLSQCLAGKHLLLASVWEGCATRVQL